MKGGGGSSLGLSSLQQLTLHGFRCLLRRRSSAMPAKRRKRKQGEDAETRPYIPATDEKGNEISIDLSPIADIELPFPDESDVPAAEEGNDRFGLFELPDVSDLERKRQM